MERAPRAGPPQTIQRFRVFSSAIWCEAMSSSLLNSFLQRGGTILFLFENNNSYTVTCFFVHRHLYWTLAQGYSHRLGKLDTNYCKTHIPSPYKFEICCMSLASLQEMKWSSGQLGVVNRHPHTMRAPQGPPWCHQRRRPGRHAIGAWQKHSAATAGGRPPRCTPAGPCRGAAHVLDRMLALLPCCK